MLLRTVEILAVAVVYVLTARLGQIFALEPGNITPVWIPSGVMLSWAILRGDHVLAGVFLGAFVGNAWSYVDLSSLWSALPGLFAGAMNGVGDVLCVFISLRLLARHVPGYDFFRGARAFIAFFLSCVVLGPLVSASFGVGSLWLAGILPQQQVLLSLLTWFLGDSVGVLMLSTLILVHCFRPPIAPRTGNAVETLAFTLVVLLMPLLALLPELRYLAKSELYFVIVPLFLWSTTRLDTRITFWAATYISVVSILLTWAGAGQFVDSYGDDAIFSLQLFILIGFSSLYVANALVLEKELAVARLNERAQRDPLTGLFNRSRLSDELDRELQRHARYGTPLSLVLFDIDHFKVVNDEHGHDVGDEVLCRLAEHVVGLVRATDVLCRWGGEEFLLLLPETDADEAARLAERIRRSVKQAQLLPGHDVTISLGVCMVRGGEEKRQLVARADAAMYCAKQAGRNRVCVEGTAAAPRCDAGTDASGAVSDVAAQGSG